MDVGEIALKLGLDSSGLPKAINKAGKQGAKLATPAFSGMFGKLSLGLGAIFTGIKLTGFISESINLASALTEVQNVVDTTFGESAKSIDAFAESAKASFGMSELSAKQFASELGATFKTAKIGTENIAEMSMGLTGLVGDIASFRDLSLEETFTKIKSGMVGETEAVRSLGISIDVASMNAFLMSKGITKSITEMSQAEKMTWRYRAILEQSTDAQGDFIKTSKSWANQTRFLSETFKELKSTLGAGFINMLTPLLSVLNGILSRALLIAESFKSWTISVFGDATAEASTGTSQIAVNIDDATDNTKALGKAAKKSVASFDQLNTLSFGSASGGSGSTTTATTTKSDNTKKKSTDTVNSLTKIMDVLKPIGNWVTNTAAPVFLDSIKRSSEAIGSILQTMKPYFDNFVQNFLVPIGGAIGNFALNAIKSITDSLVNFSTWLKTDGQWFAKILGDLIPQIGVLIIARIAVSGLFGAIALGKSIVAGVTAAITAFTGVAGAATFAIGAWTLAWLEWREHGEDVKGTFKAWGHIIEATFINIRLSVKLWLMDMQIKFKDFDKNIVTFWTNVGNNIKNAFGSIGTWLGNQFTNILSGITNLINGAIKGINGLLDGLNKVTGTNFKPLQLISTPGTTANKSSTYTGIGPNKQSANSELTLQLNKLNETIKSNNKDVVVRVNETDIARATINGINNNQRRYGSTALVY